MDPGTGLTHPAALSEDTGLLSALADQVACLQQLIAELLVKNEHLRQALDAHARAEAAEKV